MASTRPGCGHVAAKVVATSRPSRCEVVARSWQVRGQVAAEVVARSRPSRCEVLARSWPGRGRVVARSWPGRGQVAAKSWPVVIFVNIICYSLKQFLKSDDFYRNHSKTSKMHFWGFLIVLT